MASLNELINTKSIEVKVYQMLETAMLVSETFDNLSHKGELDENWIYSESESDTYATLIGYVLEIEKQNTEDHPLYYEDIREKAEEMILREYGKKKVIKQFSVDIDGDVGGNQIEKMLNEAGINVKGIAWKATWTKDGYEKGEAPISSD